MDAWFVKAVDIHPAVENVITVSITKKLQFDTFAHPLSFPLYSTSCISSIVAGPRFPETEYNQTEVIMYGAIRSDRLCAKEQG